MAQVAWSFVALVIQKFGGTSVGDPDRIRAVADHVARTKRHGDEVVLVVSAMGKETDDLLRLASEVSGTHPGRELDMLITAGERKAMALMCMALHALGVEVSVVIGGGNIFRGTLAEQWGIERAEADNIGTMGTVINSLMLRGVLTSQSGGNVEVRVMSAIPINTVAEPFIRLRAIHHLEKRYIVLFAAGIGNPYVTTDYTAAQRAIETRSEALLFAKNKLKGASVLQNPTLKISFPSVCSSVRSCVQQK